MFKFPQELTIVQVDECKLNFLEYVEKNQELAFDDSDVMRVDTVGIQLILSMVTYIASQNKSLSWQISSPIVNQSIKQLGIDEAILNQYLH